MQPTHDMIVRRLAEEDIATVATFERDIAMLSFPDDPVTDLAFYAGKLRQAITDSKSWPIVAERDGRILAWTWISRRENFITRELYADLRSIYVASEHRGRGIGGEMLRITIDFCRKNHCLRIVGRTSAANAAMRKALERAGFAPKHVVFECKVEGSGDA